MVENFFGSIPENLEKEFVETLINSTSVRIERIISRGQSSPEHGWYDQKENEWVIVLEGSGRLLFENGESVDLSKGDYINIEAHRKHKVSWTEPEIETIWLAVFYSS